MQFGTQGMTVAGAKVGHLAHLFGENRYCMQREHFLQLMQACSQC